MLKYINGGIKKLKNIKGNKKIVTFVGVIESLWTYPWGISDL